MDAFVLQDWVTIRGTTGVTNAFLLTPT